MKIGYDVLDQALAQADASYGATECHGVLTGLLCALGDQALTSFLESALVQTDTGNRELEKIRLLLEGMFQEAVTMLADPECGYYPLLPADNAPMALRVQMLAEWCQGFLVGLHQGGITDFAALPGDCPELIEDLSEIARAEMYTLEDSEDDEKAYTELVEFLHTAALVIYEELQPGAVGESSVAPSPSIH